MEFFTHYLDICIVDFDSGISMSQIDSAVTTAEIIYNAIGIEINRKSMTCLELSASERAKFRKIEECSWNPSSGPLHELRKRGGVHVGLNQVGVFIVRELAAAFSAGCGGHIRGYPACVIAGDADRWALAHELGHVLLTEDFVPQHSSDPKNLMFHQAGVLDGEDEPSLDEAQTRQIFRSKVLRKL